MVQILRSYAINPIALGTLYATCKSVMQLVLSFPLRKFYTEQMLVLVSMQLRDHVDAQLVKRFKR